jgi:hypothetical protein
MPLYRWATVKARTPGEFISLRFGGNAMAAFAFCLSPRGALLSSPRCATTQMPLLQVARHNAKTFTPIRGRAGHLEPRH